MSAVFGGHRPPLQPNQGATGFKPLINCSPPPMANCILAPDNMIAFLLRIWGLAWPYRVRLLLGVLTGIIAGFLEPLAIAVFTFVFQLIFTPDAATFAPSDIKDLPALTTRLNQP